MSTKYTLAAATTMLVMFATDATAATTVYTGSQQVNDIKASYSITTDGSIGILNPTNVIDYVLTVTRQGVTNTVTPLNAGIRGSFTASASALSIVGNQSFNINNLFYNQANGSTLTGYSNYLVLFNDFTGAGFTYDTQPISGTTSTIQANNAAGFATAGGAVSSAVPEPATWAMMTLGFGALGFAMRRKKVSTRIRFA